jgi:hypothetical protein
LDWWVTAYLERVNTALPLIITSAEFQRLVQLVMIEYPILGG